MTPTATIATAWAWFQDTVTATWNLVAPVSPVLLLLAVVAVVALTLAESR